MVGAACQRSVAQLNRSRLEIAMGLQERIQVRHHLFPLRWDVHRVVWRGVWVCKQQGHATVRHFSPPISPPTLLVNRTPAVDWNASLIGLPSALKVNVPSKPLRWGDPGAILAPGLLHGPCRFVDSGSNRLGTLLWSRSGLLWVVVVMGLKLWIVVGCCCGLLLRLPLRRQKAKLAPHDAYEGGRDEPESIVPPPRGKRQRSDRRWHEATPPW